MTKTLMILEEAIGWSISDYLEMVCDLLHILYVFLKWDMRTQPGWMGSNRIVTAEVNNHQRRFRRRILKQPSQQKSESRKGFLICAS